MDHTKTILISLLLLASLSYAGFFDPIFDPIQEFFESLTNSVHNELERTRVGRELNRVIEDISGVAKIVDEVEDIGSIVTAATPPLAIANFAIRYGHDPDQLFDRFKDRVNALENAYPGQGSGANGGLSDVELAATLQTVLEEPALPNDVYLGDECIIDFTDCDFLTASQANTYRDSYWGFSCYTEGVVDKKKVDGLNRASCKATWVDRWGGDVHPVYFVNDDQFATYYWDQCAKVHITQEDQRAFLEEKVCDQPIARHDIGDICAVDFTTCPQNHAALYNSNRIGSIAYDMLPGNVRRGYFCDLTYYGKVPLDPSIRPDCETVYVGEREVNSLLVAQPEQIPPVFSEVPKKTSPPVEGSPPLPIEGLSSGALRSIPVSRLGDLPNNAEAHDEVFVFGRTGIMGLTWSVDEHKQEHAHSLGKFGIQAYSLQEIRAQVMGQKIPDSYISIFGNERILVEVRMNNGKSLYYCVVISEGIVKEFDTCSKEGNSPTFKVSASQTVLEQIEAGEDPDIFFEAVDEGRADYEGVGFFNQLKVDIASFLLNFR